MGNASDTISSNFHTFAIGGQVIGQLFREEYNGIGGTAISDLTNNPAYLANNPSTFDMISVFDTGADHADNYGARVSGYIVPSETANYTFQFISDDAGYVDLSTDETRANATRLASETPGCCANIFSTTRTLQAGQVYFVEGVYKEGGGGDYLRLSWRNNGNIPAYTIIPGTNLAYLFSLSITQQPVATTVNPNTDPSATATFTVGAAARGAAQAIKYQWQKSSDGGATFTPLAGATSRTLTYSAVFGDNGAQFRAEVRLLGNFQTNLSGAATLTLLADTTTPFALSARGVRTLDGVQVKFNEVVSAASAQQISNYYVSNAVSGLVTIGTPVLGPDGRTVVVPIPSHEPGTVYTVHVEGVTDPTGNLMSPTNFTFQTWTVGLGSVIRDFFYNTVTPPNSLAGLTNDPRYPNNPSAFDHFAQYAVNPALGDSGRENYGARISGYLVPPITGNYTFKLISDDGGALSLSTNNYSSNLVNIITADGDCGGCGGPVSVSAYSLAADQLYYTEAIFEEGTGGDYIVIAATLTPGNPNSYVPITGVNLASLADPVGASVSFTLQPASSNVVAGSTVTLTASATGTNDYGDFGQLVYQWQQYVGGVWVNILQANSASYTTTPIIGGDCRQYRAVAYIPGANATSTVATVGGPGVLTIVADSATTAIISWSGCGGILQSATTITGPWTDVLGATSPWSVSTTSGVTFYRTR